LLIKKNINIPIINMYKKILLMFIAKMKVVKHVPIFAPIIIPKHSFGFIYFDDNNEIAIAVVPEEDWISAEAIHPTKKLLKLVFTEFVIILFNFVINKAFNENLIWSRENKNKHIPHNIYKKEVM